MSGGEAAAGARGDLERAPSGAVGSGQRERSGADGAATPRQPGQYTSELARELSERLLERFCRYASVDTQSRRDRDGSPSTPGQLELARLLVSELQQIGLSEVDLDGNGYVTATLPGTVEGGPVIGLIAHLDTSPDAPGAGVRPLVWRRYDGGVIELPQRGTRLDPQRMPELSAVVGDDLVTSGGATLLGADDKAGMAEIVTAVAHLAAHPELARPTIRVAFTPDEEIGEGATLFDIAGFGAVCAYTLDGSELGELQAETFTAAEAVITVTGIDVHPGFATGKMVNALRLAAQIVAALPADRLTPETTAGREGFVHPYEIEASAASARVRMIVRDFDDDRLAEHVALVQRAADAVGRSEPRARIDVSVARQYPNMRRFVERFPQVLQTAEAAIRAEGLEPVRTPIRGGTDGSRLSEMGLPTPNLFTGGHEYHSVREWASLQEMSAAAAVVVRLAGVWTEPRYREAAA